MSVDDGVALYVATSTADNKIFKYSPVGALVWEKVFTNRPMAIKFKNDVLYSLEYTVRMIRTINPLNGDTIAEMKNPNMDFSFLEVDKEGNVFSVLSSDFKIYRYSNAGALIWSVALVFSAYVLQNIKYVDKDDALFVTHNDLSKLRSDNGEVIYNIPQRVLTRRYGSVKFTKKGKLFLGHGNGSSSNGTLQGYLYEIQPYI